MSIRLKKEHFVGAPSYIVFKGDDGLVYAVNQKTKDILAKSADAATVIQQAINSSQSGDEIHFKPGVYELRAGLQIHKGVHLVGSGSKSDVEHDLGTIFVYTGDGVALDFGGQNQQYYGGGVRNISLRGNTEVRQGVGIRFQRVALLHLENVYVSYFKTGIDIAGCWEPYVRDIWVGFCGDNASSTPAMRVRALGSESSDRTNNGHFSDLHFGACEYIALSVESNCRRLTFKGITAEIPTYPCIGIKNITEDVDFSNLEIYGGAPCLQLGDEDVYTHRVKVSTGTLYAAEDADAVRLSNLFYSSLSNLIITTSGGHGINGDSLFHVIFNGISIRGTKDVLEKFGFNLHSGRQISIIGCNFKDIFARAIYAYNINGLTIEGCTFEECAKQSGHYYIHLESCFNAVVKGNTFYSSLADYSVRAVHAHNPTAVKVVDNILYGYIDIPPLNPILFDGTVTDSKIEGNIGYATENSGITTITGDGSTTEFTVEVPHNLISDKVSVSVSSTRATTAPPSYIFAYVDDKDADGFKETIVITVRFDTAPASGEEIEIYWRAWVVS